MNRGFRSADEDDYFEIRTPRTELDRACSDEYYVPLGRSSSFRNNIGDVENDEQQRYSTPRQQQHQSVDNGLFSLKPPLHCPVSPANPQSPTDEHYEYRNVRRSLSFSEQKTKKHLEQNQKQQDHYHHVRKSISVDSLSYSSRDSNKSLLPQIRSTTSRNTRTRLVFTAKPKSKFSFAVTAFCIICFGLYSNSRSSLKTTVQEVNNLVEFSRRLHRQLRKADRDMRSIEQELIALDAMERKRDAMERKREDEDVEEKILNQSSAFANPDLLNEMNTVQQKLKSSRTLADKLKTQVSQISKQDAIQKYGSGTIRVKMDLVFDTGSSKKKKRINENNTNNDTKKDIAAASTATEEDEEDAGPTFIIMEMASLELMPHSVYTFLEMVSNGLLDGCSFIVNALHVIKAAPLPYDGKISASRKAKQFLQKGLESVAFREYSSEYPHERYTVAFAGDGSPSFYINTEDNSAIHVGDPCFAKIISGFDTVDRLERTPTRNGIWFERRIGIKEVTIL